MGGVVDGDGVGRHAGTSDIDAIELRFGGDAVVVARPSEIVVQLGDLEVFLDLSAVGFAPDPAVDPVPAAQFGVRLADHTGDLLEDDLGGRRQVLPLARVPRAGGD